MRYKDIAYDDVHLLAALYLKEVTTDIDHGKMTAVIHYKTSYVRNDEGTFFLSFDLGIDVSLRYVLVLSNILSMDTTIDFVSGKLSCIEINRKISLDLKLPGEAYLMVIL